MSPTHREVLVASLVFSPLALGCLTSAPDPAPEIELGVFDLRGRPVDPSAMPRQVQFTLPVQLDPQGPGPLLFEGAADEGLLGDLERLPLSAAHMRRAVPLRVDSSVDVAGDVARVRFAPQHTLARAARHVFALPRSALPADARDRLERAFVRELVTAGDVAAGAAVSGAFPADGSAGVPTGLRAALLTLDGTASGYREGVWLEDARGLAVPAQVGAQPCDTLESSASTCLRVQPFQPLAPDSRYALRTGRALRDAQGAPVEAFSAQFSTAGAGAAELGWLSGDCALDESSVPVGCALAGEDAIELRLRPDGPAQIIAQLGPQSSARLSSGAPVRVRFDSLGPNTLQVLSVSASDAVGRTQLVQFEVATAAPLATLSISEVRADPLGSEPAQEFVELWNFGDRPVQLQGMTLSDAPDQPGTRIEAAFELAAGGHALLVSDSFDPANTLDASPAPGARLVRVGSAVTRSGLANAGEALYLRDAERHRLSTAPALPPPAAGACIARVGPDPRSGEPGDFAADPDGTCTPGR